MGRLEYWVAGRNVAVVQHGTIGLEWHERTDTESELHSAGKYSNIISPLLSQILQAFATVVLQSDCPCFLAPAPKKVVNVARSGCVLGRGGCYCEPNLLGMVLRL